MTNPVMDASSFLLIIKKQGEKAAKVLKTCATIPLIYYEIGNALKTSTIVHQYITQEEAVETLRGIHLGLELMKILEQETIDDFIEILSNGIKYGLTYYDSAYLTLAMKHEATLITEDKSLGKAAEKANIREINIKNHMKTHTNTQTL
jgi:predicted nucleic acid-binding protein